MFERKVLYGLPLQGKWPNNNSKFVEFLSVHTLLTPVWLVFILQYFSGTVFMTESILVNKLDNCFVVHLLEPAIKQRFTGDLCSLMKGPVKVR